MFGFNIHEEISEVFDKEGFSVLALRAALAAYQCAGGFWNENEIGITSDEMAYRIDIEVGIPDFGLAKDLLKWSRFPFYPGGTDAPIIPPSREIEFPKDWADQWMSLIPGQDARPAPRWGRKAVLSFTEKGEKFLEEGERLFAKLTFIS